MVYLPVTINDTQCVEYHDENNVRVYNGFPAQGVPVYYDNYWINSHYAYTNQSDILDYEPICLTSEEITNNVWYRNDIADVCITFSCLFFVTIFLISFICKCFFRGLFK